MHSIATEKQSRRKGHARYRGEHVAHLEIVLDTSEAKVGAMEALADAPRVLWNEMRWLQELAHDECGEQVKASAIRDMGWFKQHRTGAVLHAQSKQAVADELGQAWRAYFEGRKANPTMRPPRYRHHGELYPVTFRANGFERYVQSDRRLRLRLSVGPEVQKLLGGRFLWLTVTHQPGIDLSRCSELRLLPPSNQEPRWRVAMVCQAPAAGELPAPTEAMLAVGQIAGIDLGITLAAAVMVPGRAVTLYAGREQRSDEYWFAEEIARAQHETDWGLVDRLWQLHGRRRQHFLHALTRRIADTLADAGVKVVYLGDTSGIRWEDEARSEVKNWGWYNHWLHRWPFHKIATMLGYKLRQRGIRLIPVDESGTSSTCTQCGGELKRPKRGHVICLACARHAHADATGAGNIILKGFYGSLQVSPAQRATVFVADTSRLKHVVFQSRTARFGDHHARLQGKFLRTTTKSRTSAALGLVA